MSREVFEELKQDEAFVEKVANRIYTESDDFEDSMPEPEWICEMTDIANKYIQRFKLANKVSNQPTLNENQQQVLGWLKTGHCDGDSVFEALERITYVYEDPKTEEALESLSSDQEVQVINLFMNWALEQEEE